MFLEFRIPYSKCSKILKQYFLQMRKFLHLCYRDCTIHKYEYCIKLICILLTNQAFPSIAPFSNHKKVGWNSDLLKIFQPITAQLCSAWPWKISRRSNFLYDGMTEGNKNIFRQKNATSKIISSHCVAVVGLFLPGELDPIQYRETTHNVNKISVWC